MNKLEELIARESVLRIGEVISVDGRTVKISVDRNKNSGFLLLDGKVIRNISVNGYVAIRKGFISIIGKVEGESVVDEVKKYGISTRRINRTLTLKLVGYIEQGTFYKGVKELPLVGNTCQLLDSTQLNSVFYSSFKNEEDRIKIGQYTRESEFSAFVSVNDFFASHIGIFGNTGSGKSYTLSKLIYELFKLYGDSHSFRSKSRFLLIDFNGEYTKESSLTKNKKVVELSTGLKSKDRIKFPESSLMTIELFSIMANATEKTQKPFLKRALELYNKIQAKHKPSEYLKGIMRNQIRQMLAFAEKEKVFQLIDYYRDILPNATDQGEDIVIDSDIEYQNSVDGFFKRGTKSYFQQIPNLYQNTVMFDTVHRYEVPEEFLKKVVDILYIQLTEDMLSNRAENNHVAPAINKLKAFYSDFEKVFEVIPDYEFDLWEHKNLVVLNLSDVNLSMKKLIPLLLCTKVYNDQKARKVAGEESFLNILVDEAHNILSHVSLRESDTWKDYRLETFEEIIKEGRKFGAFLTLSSQRPSDISPTIVSQLHNYLLHRLINNNDLNAIERTVSYLDKISFESLPILATGTCILTGQASQIPMMIDVDKLEEVIEPENKTVVLSELWGEQEQRLDV